MMSQILTVAASSAPSWSFLSRLWGSLTVVQWAAVVAAAILTLGAVIEYWAKIKLLTLLGVKYLLGRSNSFERCVFRKAFIHSIGPILVVLGIAGEVVFEGRAFILEDRQEEQARQIVGSLSDKADAVSKKADALDTRLDTASRKLSDLEEGLLIQGPRWRLLQNGEAEFVKALKPFAGQRVTIVTCGNDDTERFALEEMLISSSFPKAGWDKPESKRWANCPNMLTGGNQIYFVSATGWADTQWVKPGCGRFSTGDAGNALCDVLYRLKIFTRAWQEKPLPQEEGILKARMFFGDGIPDSPAELAYKDPGRILLLIGPNAPMLSAKHPHKNQANKQSAKP